MVKKLPEKYFPEILTKMKFDISQVEIEYKLFIAVLFTILYPWCL